MYRKYSSEQLKLEIPFGVELKADNRWVRLSALMPWEKIEERYAENFKGESGQAALPGRLAFVLPHNARATISAPNLQMRSA